MMAMTSLADAAMKRLDLRLLFGRIAETRFESETRGAEKGLLYVDLAEQRRLPTARPATSASQRTNPPGIATVMPGEPGQLGSNPKSIGNDSEMNPSTASP